MFQTIPLQNWRDFPRKARKCGPTARSCAPVLAVSDFVRRLMFAAALTAILAVPSAGAEDVEAVGKITPIPDAVWSQMQGKSFNPRIKGCAQRQDLRLLTLPYRDFGGEAKRGRMIVHRKVAKDVVEIFVKLFKDKSFMIERMELVDAYGGDDDASMAANNTSAYNCRLTPGATRLSSHARGIAIDVNPLVNPYVWRKGTSPPGGTPWDTPQERTAAAGQPGLISADGAITKAFRSKGWGWGGAWKTSRDYQHFSADNR